MAKIRQARPLTSTRSGPAVHRMTRELLVPQASTSAAVLPTPLETRKTLDKSSRRLLKRRAKGLTAKTTCIHPQLRDLLVAPNAPKEVIAASYHHLARYTVPTRRDGLHQLNFIPNVLAHGCGVLACGGQHAELFLRSTDTNSDWNISAHVGKSINNSIYIAPSPGHSNGLSTPRVHICNNDCGIYRYDLHFPKRWGSLEVTQEWDESGLDTAGSSTPELDFIDRIALSTPVNHTSVSPDGRSMIAVGDTNEIFVFAISPQGHCTLIETIEGTDDAAFSTSWSRAGESFAVAGQGGTVSIYDRRFLRPMKLFRTHQRGPAGAARVIKYSQGPHELLAFTEQKNYVHVIDARTYEYHETIFIPEVELDEVGRSGISSAALESALPATEPAAYRRSLLRNEVGAGRPSTGIEGAGSRTLGSAYSFLRSLRDNPWDTMPTDDAYQSLLDLQDCPPPSTALSPAVQDDSFLSSLPNPINRPWLSTSNRRDPHAAASTVPTTVGAVLSGLSDFAHAPNASSNASGSSAITGLDWDPTGQYLYACTERIILEWEVDSVSRRSHPSASVL